eukprot:TRINITY_DN6795_c0_g1_i8.p1 TRINITY_DN6795_c0_g1~~TRINITY_DN6795_c0_g1_i8.p1  ORF type:complete len:336 (+),score=60.58 TRINITY_DN6795_c0_g1_i8:807-1814(+)
MVMANICRDCMGKGMSEQWRNFINTASEGVLVVASTEPFSLLHLNPALKKILKSIHPELGEEEVLKKNLKQLEVKLVRTGNGELGIKKTLSDMLEAVDINVDGAYYLENSKDPVEIVASKIFYEMGEALQLTFNQPNLHQTIENLQRESKTKTTLISTISHELRTPIDGIMKTMDLLVEYISADDGISLIEMTKECCNMITAHINDLTVIFPVSSRIMGSCRARSCKYSLSEFRFARQWRTVCRYCSRGLRKKSWNWNCSSRKSSQKRRCKFGERSRYAIVDERRFKQIIINILSNALKFTSHGGVAISIKTKRLGNLMRNHKSCLLYTSDAADE